MVFFRISIIKKEGEREKKLIKLVGCNSERK